MSGATPIAASTLLAFILPLEQALPAPTAKPARSNWTSWLAWSAPGKRDGADVGDPRAVLGDDDAAAGANAVVEPAPQLRQARHCVGEGAAFQRGGEAGGGGHVLGAAAIALLLPADGCERAEVPDQQARRCPAGRRACARRRR